MIGPLTPEELDCSVIDRFTAVVRAHSERTALVGRGLTLTFAELSRTVHVLAGALRSAQLPRKTVPMLLDSGPGFVVAALGAMAADQIYVPLGVRSPEARLREVLNDCNAGLLVTDTQHVELAERLASGTLQVVNLDRLPEVCPENEAPRPIDPDSIADIYYTSGSTGRPKGVPHTHRANLHDALVATAEFQITCEDRFPLLFSCEFGGVRNPMLWSLLNGASLYTYDLSPGWIVHLNGWLVSDRATNVQLVPSIFREFLNTLKDDARFPDLRAVGLVGEALTKRDVERFRERFPRGAKLVNLYGVTEAGMVSRLSIDAAREVSTAIVPIGHPFADMELVLIDPDRQMLTAPDASGEMVVRSRHVSPGYWRRPELTADAFSEEPGRPGVRSYRTGDLGRRLPDGSIMHLGRKDSQVKVRGNRIELLEVESALAACGGVGRAAVTVCRNPFGEDRLVGYVEPLPNHPASASALRAELKTRLPEYMIPTAIALLEKLPVTATGKVDRRSLPEPPPMTAANNECIAPRTVTEERLQSIWRTVLGADHFGIRDSYFELGGDSLSVIRMLVEVERAFGKALQPDLFFQRPYIEDLASALETEGPPTDWSTVLTFSASGDRPPLFCVEMHNAGTFVHLARLLGHDQPCYGIQPLSLGGLADRFTIESAAAHLIQQIRTVRPQGPYALCGLCAGGNVAYEMAQQLKAQREEIVLLALMDSFLGRPPVVPYAVFRVLQKLNHRQIKPFLKQVQSLSGCAPGMWWSQWRRAQTEARQRSEERAVRQKEKLERRQNPYAREIENRLHQLRKATRRACALYVPKHYDGRLLLFLAQETDPEWVYGSRTAWRTLALKGSEEHTVPGRHSAMLLEPGVSQMARKIRESMDHGCWGA